MGIRMLQDDGGYTDAEGEIDSDVSHMEGLASKSGKEKGKQKEKEQDTETETETETEPESESESEEEEKQKQKQRDEEKDEEVEEEEEEEEEEEDKDKGKEKEKEKEKEKKQTKPDTFLEDGGEGEGESAVRAVSSLSLEDRMVTKVVSQVSPGEHRKEADGQGSIQGDGAARSDVDNDGENTSSRICNLSRRIPSSYVCPDGWRAGRWDGRRQRRQVFLFVSLPRV